MTKHPDIESDRQTIERLGGPTKLAELLGYDKTAGGVQRIQNWKKRGIPSEVKLQRPDLFLTELMDTNRAAVDAPPTSVDRAAASDDAQPPVGGKTDSEEPI